MAIEQQQSNDAGQERRRRPRTSIRLSATVLLPDDELLYAHTIDLSSGGVCLSVPKQLQLEDEVRLGLKFEAVGVKHSLLLISRVCYCLPDAKEFRAGLQFVQISAEDSTLLEKLLA
jgi:c-di-GMP-binding flagellar brake protein YcgR